MDAATTRLTSKYALLIAALIAAPAAAQAQAVLQVSANSVALGAQAVNVTVSSSQGVATPLFFNTSVNYGNGQQGWFNVQTSAQFTQQSVNSSPTTITIGLALTPGAISTTGSITLIDSSNPSDPGQTITVNYTAGGGGGGNTTLSASPSTVAMSISPNSSVGTSTTIQLTTNSPTVVSGNIALLSNTAGSSLTLSTSNFSVSSSSPFQFSINGAAFTPAGTYSATIQITPSVGTTLTIPVTYSVVTGTSASPSSVNLSYPSGTQSAQVTVTASSGSFYATASSTNGWLLVNGASGTGNYLASGSQITLSVNTNVAFSLPTGNYTGQVSITGLDGTQAVITANLSINGASSGGSVNISPSSVTFSNVPVGSGTQSNTVELTTSISNVFYNASVNTNTGQSWLSLSQYSGTLASGNQNNPLTLYVFPGGLSAGTYSGTVNLTYSNGYSGTAQIPVTLNVGTNGTGTGGNGQVYPSSLTFWYQVGGGSQNLSSSILVNSTGTWSATATTNTGQNWLSVGSGGSAPSQTVSVLAVPGGLSAGSYSGSISITSNGGTVSVPVTLTVTNSMVATTSPGSFLVSSYNSGDPNPQTDIEVYASDGTSQPVTAATTTSWITVVSNANPTTVATFLLTINAAGLPNGLNTGSVTFTVNNASDTTWTLPVAIIVNGSTTGGSGPLNFSASSLAFNSNVGGATQSQTLTVSSSSASNFSVSASSSGGWLSVTPTNSSLPATLTVTANPTGLTGPGYTGSLVFTANGVTQTVPVNFSVGSGSGSGSGLTATPSSLSFAYTVGGSTPASQSITVASSTGVAGFFVASASTSTGGSWLSVSPTTNLNTGSSVQVGISPSGLTAGSYSGSITLTNPSTAGTLIVPVSLTVTGAPSITASPTTLSFNYSAGGTTPASQSVSVAGSGSFSATATSTGNWLSVTPSSGTAPTTLTVSANPAGLSAGTYNGSVAVAATGGSTGSTTVSVSLVVTAPLPTVTQISNAGSYANGAISPGELITIFGTAIGPTTPVQLTLTGTGTVSNNIGNVQVLVNGIACPLIYVSSTQVSAVVPYAISIFQTAEVYVSFLGQSSNAIEETVATTAPGIFTANSSGTGPGAILNQNSSVNSPSNPAPKGSVVTLYLTGEGQTSPAGVTGSVTQALTAPPYTPSPLLPVAVLIDGIPAAIQFAGEAPGIVAGVMQVNVTIPATTPTGAQSVQVSIGGRPTQAGVTVSVQ